LIKAEIILTGCFKQRQCLGEIRPEGKGVRQKKLNLSFQLAPSTVPPTEPSLLSIQISNASVQNINGAVKSSHELYTLLLETMIYFKMNEHLAMTHRNRAATLGDLAG
jgi:hypothetical protein